MNENIVPLPDWGKQLLEELLFRAAEAAGDQQSQADSVEVTLTFRLRPDLANDCLEISVPGVVESSLITRLPRPFYVGHLAACHPLGNDGGRVFARGDARELIFHLA